jgi:hypothetical protein
LAKKATLETLDRETLRNHFTINQATEPELSQDQIRAPRQVQMVTQNPHLERLSLLSELRQNHLLCLVEILLDQVMEREDLHLDQAEDQDRLEQDSAKASIFQNLSASLQIKLKQSQK